MAYISKRKKLYFVTFISIAVVCAAIALFVIYVMPKMAIVKFVDGTMEREIEIAESITVEKGTALPEELPSPTKTGYTFDFWYHSKKFNDQVRVLPGVDIIESDTILYANFIPNEYTISYNTNGAVGPTPPTVTQLFGTKLKLPSGSNLSMVINGETKVLYGWCTRQDGLGVHYEPGTNIDMFAKDTVMYAIWGNPKTKLNYVVGDGGSYINPATYESNKPIPAEADIQPHRPGYIFEGWYTSESYTTEVIFGEGGTILTGENMSIYAKYRPVEYTLTYKIQNPDSGEWEVWEHNGTPQVFTIYHDSTVEEPLLQPSQVGRQFIGWYVDDTLLGKYTFGNTVTGQITLYARFGALEPVADETGAAAFTYVKDDTTQTVKITGVKDLNMNALVIPRQIDGYNVVEIQSGVRNMPVLTIVKIPYTVRTIADTAFTDCPLIQRYEMTSQSNYFTVESGVLYKYSADRQTMSLFRYPASKEGINYTTLSNVTEVAAYAFDNAQYLHNVTINAKNVLKFAFKKSTINNLTIGSAVESIAKDAFRDCYMLETVVSNSSEYKIEDGGIYNANKTELIKYFGKTLNKTYNSIATLTTINDYAFDGCSNIVSIVLGPNVRYINAMAFSDCSNLTTLKLEAPQVTIYNSNVINKCSSLETIYCYTTSTNPGYNILLAAPEVTEFSIQFVQI